MVTFSLQFKNKKDLNTFFSELKQNSKGWDLREIESKLSKKSFLDYKTYALSVFFTGDFYGEKTTAVGLIEIAKFETYIKIIDIRIPAALGHKQEKLLEVEIDNNITHNILSFFYNDIIDSLQSKVLLINKNVELKYDLSLEMGDLRMPRPIYYKEKESGSVVTLNRLELNKIGSQYFNFTPPNNVALLLNVSKKELEISKELYNGFISKSFSPKKEPSVNENDLSKVYDYLEHIQTSIIFAYSAVESFANTAIPYDFEFRKTNTKGVLEVWNKGNIESHFKTSEKLKALLPKILNIEEPTRSSFWNKFTELEKLRNDIIHPKQSSENRINGSKKFLIDNIFSIIYSAYELIEYFCNADTKHEFFPIGISNSDIKIIEVENFSDQMSKLDWDSEMKSIDAK